MNAILGDINFSISTDYVKAITDIRYGNEIAEKSPSEDSVRFCEISAFGPPTATPSASEASTESLFSRIVASASKNVQRIRLAYKERLMKDAEFYSAIILHPFLPDKIFLVPSVPHLNKTADSPVLPTMTGFGISYILSVVTAGLAFIYQ